MSNVHEKNTDGSSQSSRPRRRRMWPWLVLVGFLAVGALTIPRAIAFVGHHGWGHGGPHGEMSPEALNDRMSFLADHVLDEVEATDEQRVEVEAIIDRLVPEMVALHDEAATIKVALHDAMATDDIDVAELEALRAEAVGLFDRGTSLALESFVELHGVLTPEQREQIRERIQAHHGHGRGHGCPYEASPESTEQ